METKLVIQYSRPVFQLMGEAALLIRMGEGIDAVVNQKVHSLTRTLRNNLACGVEEIIPGYSTLLVRFNPEQVTASEITGWVNIQYELLHIGVPEVHRLITIPTVYGGSYGPDLEFVAGHCQMSTAEVIRLHSEQEYPVFFIGFLPGFPYLGGMNPRLETPRLEIPRTVLPAGSVGIAGLQTGIYPLASPGGWRIIGQTPLMLFNPQCDPPSLLQPGDRVRFVPCNSWKEASHGV